MTFLDPITGLTAAVISFPLLLLLYFLKLRRRALRVSSTLLWEQAVQDLQVNVPLRWLRVSVALILQLLVLATFAAALARPTIRGGGPAGLSGDRVVIVIDQSASMSARDAQPGARAGGDPREPSRSRLDDAKREATELVHELARTSGPSGARPTVMVVRSAAAASVVQPLTSVESDLVDAIAAIEPTDQPGGVGPALDLLDAVRGAPSESEAASSVAADASIVAYTDSPPADTRGLAVRTVILGAADRTRADNLGVVSLNVRRDTEKPEVVRVFAHVVNAGSGEVEAAIRGRFDDAVVAVRTIVVAPGGEAAASFDFERRGAGVVVVSIERPDDLDSDNAAAASIGPAAAPAILVVAPLAPGPAEATGAENTPRADDFLLGFFQSLPPRALKVVSLEGYKAELARARGEGRRPWGLFNLVVFDRTEPLPGELPAQPSMSFGAGLPIDGLRLAPPPPENNSAGRRVVQFDSWKRSNPLMRAVALDDVIVSPVPRPLEAAAPPATSLASGPDGPLIAALEESVPGSAPRPRRVVVAFPLARSNWPPMSSFAIFMANAVDLLTGRGEAAVGRWFSTEQPVSVHPMESASEVSGAGPRSFQVPVPRAGSGSEPDPGKPGPLSPGVLDRVGVYTLTGAEEPVVCVNLLDESETRLGLPPRAAAPEPGASGNRPASSPATTSVDDPRGRREIWHWFALAGAGLAVAEWFLFALRIRP